MQKITFPKRIQKTWSHSLCLVFYVFPSIRNRSDQAHIKDSTKKKTKQTIKTYHIILSYSTSYKMLHHRIFAQSFIFGFLYLVLLLTQTTCSL